MILPMAAIMVSPHRVVNNDARSLSEEILSAITREVSHFRSQVPFPNHLCTDAVGLRD
jgi:hypothetical protein